MTPSATSTAEVDALTAVSTIVVRPEALELRDGSGAEVESLGFDDPLADVVASLSVAVGTDPVTKPYEGGLETPAGVSYEWAGFRLLDFQPVDGKFPNQSDFAVFVTAGASGEVGLVTSAGYKVGDPIADIAAEVDAEAGRTYFAVEYGEELTTPAGENIEYPNAWAVTVGAAAWAGSIERIMAPVNLSHWVS